jgi:hypothetical protein
VNENYQGRGIGSTLYNLTLEDSHGLISDSTLTDNSFNMWKKLSKLFPTYLVDISSGIEIIRKVKGISRLISTQSERFLIVKKEYEKQFINNYKDK